MRLLSDLTDLRRKTIAFWVGFTHPGSERDIARVYAFRDLDPATATDADVSKAYGGDGWAPHAPCAECGAPAVIEVGKSALCGACLRAAAAAVLPPAPPTSTDPKPGVFSRLFNKG